MQRILQFLPVHLALTMAAILASAAIAPSAALAAHERSAAAPKIRHSTAAQYSANDRRYRALRAYGAAPTNTYGAMLGGSGVSGPSYPGYGYGYGDNSHGCSACVD